MLDTEGCFRALRARDSRFDGVFFVGVTTTGIYCRPICPARPARRESCRFFDTAAGAEREGFRPCLRCRPEIAPGNARVDAVSRVAASAMARIEAGALNERGVDDLAAEFGITARHLRRAVEGEFGVSPVEVAQTQRLLLAKQLLTETPLPVTDVAYASGFASVRRFNALFQQRYRLSPKQLRGQRNGNGLAEQLVCQAAYRPPLGWISLLEFLRARACPGVECVEANRYMRTVAIGKHRGWIAVSPSDRGNSLLVRADAKLAPVLPNVLARVKRLFDLGAHPRQIEERLGADSRLLPLIRACPGLRVPGAFDPFEMIIRAIVGQQVSVRAAATLMGRIAQAFAETMETPFPALNRQSPEPKRMAQARTADLRKLGLVTSRAESILAVARAVASGELKLEPGANVERTMMQLKELPGIGEWTAQYAAMRALAWPDAFPHTDLGLCKALGERSPKRVLELAEGWSPWRSYAVMWLWKSLEERKK